ncbi:MAG: DUF4351 domain-containing protein [Planctomycetes bacterium]|nr:DUF4351 domain-containing protein [Planctomycetota bacterium]
MIHLRVDLEERFQEELNAFEKEQQVTYITSVERVAIRRSTTETFLMQLTELCGDLPGETEQRIRALDVEQLQKLGKDLLRFQSLGDLESWLEREPK